MQDNLGAVARSIRGANGNATLSVTLPQIEAEDLGEYVANKTAELLSSALDENDSSAVFQVAEVLMSIFDDPCADLDCGAYGECEDGLCVCSNGYTGELCEIAPPVDGGYSDWSDWSSCSASCEGGNEFRERTCTNPAPKHGGADCADLGEYRIDRSCNTEPCLVVTDGGFSPWSEWSICSNSCPDNGSGGFYPGQFNSSAQFTKSH